MALYGSHWKNELTRWSRYFPGELEEAHLCNSGSSKEHGCCNRQTKSRMASEAVNICSGAAPSKSKPQPNWDTGVGQESYSHETSQQPRWSATVLWRAMVQNSFGSLCTSTLQLQETSVWGNCRPRRQDRHLLFPPCPPNVYVLHSIKTWNRIYLHGISLKMKTVGLFFGFSILCNS